MTFFMEKWIHPEFYYMPLFIFVSGYFYKKQTDDKSFFLFFKEKFFSLIVPYFAWNLIYGCLCSVLKKADVIAWGDKFNFTSLFISPWTYAGQFGFNIPSWFLLSLFLVSGATFILRKVLHKMNILNDWALTVFLFAVSAVCIKLSKDGYNYGWYLCFLRAGYLLPYFQFGFIYRKLEGFFSEKRLAVVGVLSFLLYFVIVFSPGMYAQSVFARFGGKTWGIIAATIISLILLAEVCDFLAPAAEKSKALLYIGDNTFTVMMHHPFFIFLPNFALFILNHFRTVSSFDLEMFRSTIWYCYPWRDWRIYFFYAVFALAMPLIIKYFSDRGILKLYKKRIGGKEKDDSF